MNEEPRLSITQMTTLKWSLPDLVAYCKDFGFPGLGIWMPRLAEFGEERGIDLILEAGLHVSSVGPTGGFTGWNGQSFHDAVIDAADALEIAGQLGARSLTLCSGPRAGHTRGHARRLVLQGLERLADRAGELQVALSLKPMRESYGRQWTFLHTLRGTLELIAEADHPAVKLAFGTYHLGSEPDLLTLIPQITPLLGSVQLSDGHADAPADDCSQLLWGEGSLPMTAIVQSLLDNDYDGLFEIDIWSRDLWRSNYADVLAHCRDQFVRELAIRR